MVFLLKASILILVLWAFYKLLLQHESFFRLNRMFLLFGLILVFALPFVSLPKLVNNQGALINWLDENLDVRSESSPKTSMTFDFDEITPVEEDGTKKTIVKVDTTETPKDYTYWLSQIYFFGTIVLFARLIFQIGTVFLKVRTTEDKLPNNGFTILNVDDDLGPRSFFSYIFINPEKYDLETYEQILAHEQIHAKKYHTIDLLMAEITLVFLWFNPFVWLYRKEVEKNIEYQTDALLIQSKTIKPKNYQLSLLEIAVERKPLTIVSNYNQSLIKKRIIMMNKQKSNGQSIWKYAFIVPTLFITLLLLNRPYFLQSQEPADEVYNDFNEENNYENEFDDDLKPLLRAAGQGDYGAVKKMLENGADVNLLQEGEGTPLTMAIRSGEFEIAKFLLEKGADPNLGTNGDGHPLWMAARKGDIELVRLLVENGVDVNTKYPGDGSALIQAAGAGNLEMVKVLVALKADVNMPVEGDGNPLIMASKGGYLNIVEYLINKGADVDYEVVGDEVPLINASEQGHLDVIKYLVAQGANVNKKCTENINGKIRVRTALIMAKKKGHSEIVEYLIAKGAKE